jgi:hypothetical protein
MDHKGIDTEASLRRLCESLVAADYNGVSDATIEFHLQANQPIEVMEYVSSFKWPHGRVSIHARIVTCDFFDMFVESWHPTNSNEFMFAIILSSHDVVVPPRFWKDAQHTIASYIGAGAPTNLLGVCLYPDVEKQVAVGKRHLNLTSGLYFPQAWTQGLVMPFVRREKMFETAITSRILNNACKGDNFWDRGVLSHANVFSLARSNDNASQNRKWCPVLLELEQQAAIPPHHQQLLASSNRVQASPVRGTSIDATFVIKVLVNRRFSSLKRLCESLLSADYQGNKDVALEFYLEANQSADILDYVVDFRWPHGRKDVHGRVVKGGLIAVVVESWFPASDTEYAILLEDDIEVSPLYYVYLKAMLSSYLDAGSPESVISISLYTPRVVETEKLSSASISHRRFRPDELIFNITGNMQR